MRTPTGYQASTPSPKTKQPVRLRKADLDTMDEELGRQTQRDNPRTAHHQPT
ncbi:hypothetical protein J3T91_01145 [Bifidobacterium sp. B4001]|nr:hypothetical protein [Bifidobacterium sp. B4001]